MRPKPKNLKPTKLSAPDVIPVVWGRVEVPSAAGPHPGVILLPGSAGWHSEYAQFARSLADSGFVTLIVDYLKESGREPSPRKQLRMWPQWQTTVRNAIIYLQASPLVAGRPIGLVGYSLGAYLAVSVGSMSPGVKAVVDFFGGGGGGSEPLDKEVRRLPPLLILHGEVDSIVPASVAYSLRDAVIAHGGQVQMHLYPGADHAFNVPWAPEYSEAEASDSMKRMINFLKKRLGKQ